MRHPKNFWKIKDNVINESKKYTSRTEFKKKSNKAYEEARKNNFLNEMTWLKPKNIYKEKIDSVYKYFFKEQNAVYIGRTINTSLRDLQHRNKENDTVYKFAQENNTTIPNIEIIENDLTISEGINKEIYWADYYKSKGFLLINKRKCGGIGSISYKWTKKKCFEEAKKYTSRNDFAKNSNSAYQKSLYKGWLDKMTWLTHNRKYPRGYWNIKENVINESKKYSSKKEFLDKCPSAYLAAYKKGYLNELTWLIKQEQKPKNYWTYEKIKEESLKYKSRSDFFKNSSSAYYAALKLNIMDDLYNKIKG